MTQKTKDALLKLARQDKANADDNLYRANMAARGRDTSLEWGQSGETLQSIIDGYKRWSEEAAAVIAELDSQRAA